MVRGTTPTLNFGIPFNTELIDAVYITFCQEGRTVLEKDINSIEMSNKELTVRLSQQDTLSFNDNSYVELQIRIKNRDGSAYSSKIIVVSVERILKDGEI